MTKNAFSITYNLLYAFMVYYSYKHRGHFKFPFSEPLFKLSFQ